MDLYDNLKGLEDSSLEIAKRIFGMASQLGGLANGYFFEKESGEVLRDYARVEVVDSEGNHITNLDARSLFLRAFLLGQDPAYEYGKEYRLKEVNYTDEQLNSLYNLRRDILQALKERGDDAVVEFSLVASLIGAEGLSQSDYEQLLGDLLDGNFSRYGIHIPKS